MKFNWGLMSKKEKGIVIFAVCFAVLVILLIIVFSFKSRNTDILVEPTLEPTPNVVETNVVSAPPVETVVPQENVVSLYRAKVKNIIDYSTSIEYVLGVGADNGTELHVTANGNTNFIDIATKKVTTSKAVIEGSDIVVYVKGNVIANDLTALVVLVGEDTSYQFARIVSIEDYNDEGYLWEIENTTDRLYIDKNSCSVIDSYTGSEILNIGLVKENDKVLYKANPEFEIVEDGNVYYCNEIITMKEE